MHTLLHEISIGKSVGGVTGYVAERTSVLTRVVTLAGIVLNWSCTTFAIAYPPTKVIAVRTPRVSRVGLGTIVAIV